MKIEYFEFDGAREILAIRDSARKEYCTYAQWSDGNSYCAPFAPGSYVFSDPQCKTKIGLGSTNPCNTSHYFAEYTVDCDGVFTFAEMFEAGTKLPLDRYYTLRNGTCVSNPVGGSVLYALGRAVSPGDLARLTLGSPEGAGRIQSRFITSPDGLRKRIPPAFDSQLGVNCDLRRDGRCVPFSTAPTSSFGDSQCTTPAAEVDKRCPHRLAKTNDSCGYRALGQPIQSGSRFASTPTGCQQIVLEPNHALFELGAPVTLATLARGPVDIGSRIRPIRFTDLDISAGFVMFDSAKQAECAPSILADGSVYCFPNDASVGIAFTDPNCAPSSAIEIVAISKNLGDCDAARVPAFGIKSSDEASTCARNVESRPVGAEHKGPLFDKSTGVCAPALPLSTYYDVGPPIPLSDLARGALVVDP